MALENLTKITSVGISTGITFSGVTTHTGTIKGTDADFSGNVSVGGTLTYEDVKSVDSVGVITARAGVNISGGNLQVDGTNVINSGRALYNVESVKLADTKNLILGTSDDLKIYHSGSHSFISEEGQGALKVKGDDVRFENASGTEALRLDSSGRLLIGTTTEGYVSADNLTVADAANAGITIRSGTGNLGTLAFSDGTTGAAEYDGYIQYSQADQYMDFGGAGGNIRLRIDSSGRLLHGTTASRSIADGTPNVQVEGTAGTASLGLVRNQNNAGGSNLSFAKSRSGSLGGSTIVQDDDTLGNINFAAADGTDINTIAASIVAQVDGTPGANDMPGRLIFKTTADGANSATERLRIDSSGRVMVGQTSATAKFEVTAADYNAATFTTTENGSNGPQLQLMHNSASPAAADYIGQIRFSSKDSAGNTDLMAKIETVIDDPTSGQETAHLQFGTRGLSSWNPILRLKNRSTASAPSYTTDDINGIILDVYNTGNPYPRYMNFIAKSAGNTDSNITFWTESVGGSPTEKVRIHSHGQLELKVPDANPALKITPSGTNAPAAIDFNTPGTGSAVFKVQGTERLSIRSTGNVSIASSLAVTGVTTSSSYDLSAIDKDISQTAVDVFVYDTSKDSDGGAWRYRTQGTSWYNETLGTSTRGNRKEFPAVAVIVATTSNVMIYDGDDPEMPLWMKFDQHGAVSEAANMITAYSNNVNKVKALNGILLVGMKASSGNEGLFEINFITDRGRVYRSEGSGITGGYYSKAISERNSQTGIHRGDYNDTAIVTQNILSIDMTVLPNSPIDKDTGLPRLSYAVGTDGGATILKSHGEKEFISVDYTNSSSAYRNTDLIQFTEDGGFIFGLTHDNGAEQWMYKYDTLGYTDKTISYHGNGGDLHLMPRRWESGHATTGVELHYNDQVNTSGGRRRRLANKGKVLATDYGLTYIDDKPKDHGNGMVAYATTTYHTGWMHGDVILATLSDTDTTAPTNLVTNGTFDSGTGWSLSGAGAFSISGGKLNGDGTAGDSFAQQAVSPAVVNRYDTYDITFTVTRTAGSISARVGNSSYTPAVSSSGTFTYSVECGSTTTETVLLYGSGFNGTVDAVSVRRNIQDYSKGINGSKKGLKMAGTVTKTAAATGSDIVAYSGFSASNYLNFDSFNLGQGDFSVSVWCIPSTDGTNEFILELDDASQNSNRMYLLITGTNPPRIYVSWDSDVGGSELEPAAWNHIVVGRRSGMGYVYLNGRPISDGTKAFTTSLNGNGMGTIGNYSATPNAGYAWSGKLALLRISKTMPSTEQVKKMYHDEKKLFQPNAKCTIYGGATDPNAISYDDGTGILHVGTDQGRSEFNGFVRINNTTDAVATAVSASNGLVAEE